ncbi:MAG: UDP-N-acetylglucosamine--N-acetylmuramyl-(pentapeptide) pyrophosphoryl-undecaprenol N-acetylglucosamine transferase, partial [Ilumatobacteraceae bacterium]
RNTAGDDTARRKAAEVFGIDPSRRVIVAMGGSLGSRTINDAVEKWVAANGARNDVAVLHFVGERYIDDASLGIRDGIQYVRRASHQNMADVWLLADVVVCRAGASTIAELITVGSAAVVVPWADAADDHQRLNASLLADSGAAIVVEERDVADRFAAELSRVVDDAILRERLVAKSYALGALNRSSAIGSIIEAAAR